MKLNSDELKSAIRAKIIELAEDLGEDASEIGPDEIIPASGYLDSAAIMELVLWLEREFELKLTEEEINIDNLGTINAMTDFLMHRKQNQT